MLSLYILYIYLIACACAYTHMQLVFRHISIMFPRFYHKIRACATRLNFSDAESSIGTSQLSSLMEDSARSRASVLGHSQVHVCVCMSNTRVCIHVHTCTKYMCIHYATSTHIANPPYCWCNVAQH